MIIIIFIYVARFKTQLKYDLWSKDDKIKQLEHYYKNKNVTDG